MRSAAVELAAGIMLGLYNCRHGNSETLLDYCPDYAAERAAGLLSDCARLGIELPPVELLDLTPGRSAMLHGARDQPGPPSPRAAGRSPTARPPLADPARDSRRPRVRPLR